MAILDYDNPDSSYATHDINVIDYKLVSMPSFQKELANQWMWFARPTFFF